MVLNDLVIARAEASLVEDGFAVVEGVLDAQEIENLRLEYTALADACCDEVKASNDQDSKKSLGKTLVQRFGCILEPVKGPLSNRLREGAENIGSYRELRRANCRHHDLALSNAICDWLFTKSRSAKENTMLELLQCALGENCFFYNEQYICKPAGFPEGTGFNWHRDSDRAKTRDAFVSCWFALSDNIDAENGGLMFRGYGWKNGDPPQQVSVNAGGMVLIAHDVEHCSIPNFSGEERLAYMVQFSQVPMRNLNDDQDLIAFAVQVPLT